MNIHPILPDSEIAVLQKNTFSDEAGQQLLPDVPGGRLAYQSSIADVWRHVDQGHYGLVPVENSSGGVVWPHLDTLGTGAYSIVGEVNLKVRMCAGMLPDGDLEAAQSVYSHQKGIDQCANFIQANNLHDAHATRSTAAAAELVAESGDKHSIALASQLALQDAGLIIPDDCEDIANLPGEQNITQFYAIHRNGEHKLPNPESKYHAVVVTPENERGVLHRISGIMHSMRTDMTSIHSRPIGRKKYSFYIEMERSGTPDEFEAMVEAMDVHYEIQNILWLGSWDAKYEN